jgi:hypothetical protein
VALAHRLIERLDDTAEDLADRFKEGFFSFFEELPGCLFEVAGLACALLLCAGVAGGIVALVFWLL